MSPVIFGLVFLQTTFMYLISSRWTVQKLFYVVKCSQRT